MFKSCIAASVFLASLAGVALADGLAPDEVSMAPVAVATPQAISWSGFYVGGQASSSSGLGTLLENDILVPGVSGTFSGSQFGAFAGYNFELGSFVLGAEAAYLKGPVAFDTFPTFYLDNIFDIKVRAGKPIGSALIYGVVGRSFGTYTRSTFEALPSQGLNYGAGVDVQVTGRIFVGLEYLVRDMLSADSTIILIPKTNYRQVVQSVQFRVGMKF